MIIIPSIFDKRKNICDCSDKVAKMMRIEERGERREKVRRKKMSEL